MKTGLFIPASVLALPGLTWVQRVLLAWLCTSRGGRSSNAEISAFLRVSEKSVERLLRQLRGRGLLESRTELGKRRLRFRDPSPVRANLDTSPSPARGAGSAPSTAPVDIESQLEAAIAGGKYRTAFALIGTWVRSLPMNKASLLKAWDDAYFRSHKQAYIRPATSPSLTSFKR
jgi:hypothetical protein